MISSQQRKAMQNLISTNKVLAKRANQRLLRLERNEFTHTKSAYYNAKMWIDNHSDNDKLKVRYRTPVKSYENMSQEELATYKSQLLSQRASMNKFLDSQTSTVSGYKLWAFKANERLEKALDHKYDIHSSQVIAKNYWRMMNNMITIISDFAAIDYNDLYTDPKTGHVGLKTHIEQIITDDEIRRMASGDLKVQEEIIEKLYREGIITETPGQRWDPEKKRYTYGKIGEQTWLDRVNDVKVKAIEL